METYEESKRDIFNKLVAKDDKGNLLSNEDGYNYVDAANLDEYVALNEQLLDLEIEVVDFKIKLSELDGIVNTNDLLALELIVDEDLE
jgi:hypothetical protein